jgi:hypothetical protein
MLFSSRNFLLYLLSIGFLVIAIVSTLAVKTDQIGSSKLPALDSEVSSTDMVYSAVTSTSSNLDRVARATELRNKISASGIAAELSAPAVSTVAEPSINEDAAEVDDLSPQAVAAKGSIATCSEYSEFTSPWDAQDLQFAVVEGARLIYRDTVVPVVVGTSTLSEEVERVVYAQLPLFSVPGGEPQCVETDVIGIAMDGSLIRNNEQNLYAVFGAETLIGYALDGFPLYGTTKLPLDVCGGMVVNGQYRYHLAADRDSVINCFSGQAIRL